MPEASLEDLVEGADRDGLFFLRALALHAHATLERALCWLFSHAGEMKNSTASLIFHNFGDHQIRNSIIIRLVEDRYESVYATFFRSFIERVNDLEKRRQEIIAWPVHHDVERLQNCRDAAEIMLAAPGWWLDDASSGALRCADLEMFVEECDLMAGACDLFVRTHEKKYANVVTPFERSAVESVFRSPTTFPLDVDSALFKILQARADPSDPPES